MTWLDDIERRSAYERASVVVSVDGHAYVDLAGSEWKEHLVSIADDSEPDLGNVPRSPWDWNS